MKTSLAILLLAAAALTGCSAPRHVPDADGVSFPLRDASYRTEGIVVAAETLRLLQPGLSKDQTRQLLGNPHFSEGLFSVQDWNYLVKVPAPAGGLLECQLQLRFDRQHRVESTHWQTADCAQAVGAIGSLPAKPASAGDTGSAAAQSVGAAPADSADPANPADQVHQEFRFPFGRSSLGDLQQQDLERLQALATRLVSQSGALHSVTIAGHADRIGSPDRKYRLSLERAHAVATYFVARGLDPQKIEIIGNSDRDPVTQCAVELPAPAQIACLEPDRWVTVTAQMALRGGRTAKADSRDAAELRQAPDSPRAGSGP